MKRTIVTLALVAAFVFAFAAVAMAAIAPSTAYRGFTPVRTQAEVDAGYIQGFISFAESQAEMQRNGVNGALQNTAHGGYITTTSLCAVCHSAHRAPGVLATALEGGAAGTAAANVAGTPEWRTPEQILDGVNANRNLYNVTNQLFLTAGGTGCEACHVPGSSQASTLLVEWGAATGGGGPHASAGSAVGGACVLCHAAGVHGLSGSRFNVMNVFMLGGTRATATTTSTPTETRDAQIVREIQEGRVLRAGMLDVPTTSVIASSVAGAPTAVSTWWYDGARSLGPIGTTPPALGAGATAGATQYGAARSLATAYTCGESGCHDATAMFNLNWGMGFERVDNVRATTQVQGGFPGAPYNYPLERVGTVEVTGHIMPSLRSSGAGGAFACGPCHGGHSAGFPTASTNVGVRDESRQAFGCDQCHDMVGVATNSTAWPHGNRNILVYEWLADGTQIETTAAAGNLWMYGGNIARSAAVANLGPAVGGVPMGSRDVNQDAASIPGGGAQFRGPTSVNASFADQSWRVLTDVTGGRYGLPGTGTGLQDGSCLKCHVPLDAVSLANTPRPSMGADAVRHAWTPNAAQGGNLGSTPLNPMWSGVPVTGSNRLFLYR